MSVAVIQGASGGLGRSLAAHILRHTNLKVYALTHRSQSSESDLRGAIGDQLGEQAKSRLSVMGEVDVRDEQGLENAAKQVKEREGAGTVRLIASMAGILHPEKSLSGIDLAKALDQFQINTLGHLLTYKHFVPLIPSRKAFTKLSSEWGKGLNRSGGGDPAKGLIWPGGSLCWSMSARVGSISDNERGGWYSYRASKAAVNQVIRCLDHELINKSSSGVAVAYHPGTVLTPFTAPVIGHDAKPDPSNGRFTIDDAVKHMTNVMSKIKRDEGGSAGEWGGRCWDWKGERIEW
ncbi:hypothetical protein IAU60_000886 [Kwoniella sp. DSM 27419]